MKIATFNINGINRRIENLVQWLAAATPDIVCLQETRVSDAAFPRKDLAAVGYCAVIAGDGGYNGVAILARETEPVLIRKTLPGDDTDRQPRYIEAAVAGIVVGCIYLPNGNPQPGPKFDYKLRWFSRLIAHAQSLMDADVPVVLAGDYNVVPTALDIYPTTSWTNDALVQPQSRAAYVTLLEQGWTDAMRQRYPSATGLYTFWDYKRGRWGRDAGLRIDHLLLSSHLASRLTAAGVDREVRGRHHASDHAPAWIVLKTLRIKSARVRCGATPQ